MKIHCLYFYFLKKVLCLVFLLGFSQCLFSQPAKLKITENDFFEIVGTDLVSTQFVNELSNYVADSILRDFNKRDYVPSRKILVKLFNKKNSLNDDHYYELSISDLGFVTINIYINESLGMPKLIEAMTVSFIQSFGYSIYGRVFLEKYPSKAWILKGLSQNIYVSLRPYVSRIYYEQAIIDGFNAIDCNARFLALSAPSDVQSFGLYRYIKSNQISRKESLRIIKNALLGEDVLPAIYRSFKFDSEESLRNGLGDFLESQYRNNLPQFESLSFSKNWLEALGDFSSIEIQSTQAKHNSLHLLWLNREDPSVVQFIEARIRLISYALNQINPLYYNAAQSLALTYQKILDGLEEWELLYYFSDFLGELDKANTVSLQITKQLQLQRP